MNVRFYFKLTLSPLTHISLVSFYWMTTNRIAPHVMQQNTVIRLLLFCLLPWISSKNETKMKNCTWCPLDLKLTHQSNKDGKVHSLQTGKYFRTYFITWKIALCMAFLSKKHGITWRRRRKSSDRILCMIRKNAFKTFRITRSSNLK